MAFMDRRTPQDAPPKIPKTYRLPSELVEAIELTAIDTNQDCTWVVENILAVALGLRKMPKPLRLPRRFVTEEVG